MVRWLKTRMGNERGDTLIEVTLALGIMASVLVSATVLTLTAFRLGVTARQRTQLVNTAIQQAEALRSMRDNSDWTTFITGPGGIATNASVGSCLLPSDTGQKCFTMTNTSGTWLATTTPSSITNAVDATVPAGAVVEIRDITSHAVPLDYNCSVKLSVHYGIQQNSSSVWQEGEVTVELANQNYVGTPVNYVAECAP